VKERDTDSWVSPAVEASVPPWPGDPKVAWVGTEEYASTHRLSDRPEAIPRMDDLGGRLRRMSGRLNRIVGAALLAGIVVLAMTLVPFVIEELRDPHFPQHPAEPLIFLGAVVVGIAATAAIVVFLLLFPRRAWGPTPWVAAHAMLCEAHPSRLRLRAHPSSAAVATILIGGGDIEGPEVRMDGERAIRIVAACEQWAAQLEADPAAYREFWQRWRREDPEVLPTELVFGSEAAGGFITCVDRRHRWFLLIPHRRRARPSNPWQHAHQLPVWWTTEHADSVGIDWGSLNGTTS